MNGHHVIKTLNDVHVVKVKIGIKKKKMIIKNKAENKYADYLEKNNIEYQYQPKYIKLINGERYTPDFYLFDENKYIEVIGTRQAYGANKHKYELVKKMDINFEIVRYDLKRRKRIFKKNSSCHSRSVYIDDDLLKELERIAKNEDRSISYVVGEAIKLLVKKQNKEGK